MKKTWNYDFQQFYTLWIPERGHIWSQETSKQIKMQKKDSTQYISLYFFFFFLWWKWGTFIVAFGRNRPKWAYLAQNGQMLVTKRSKSQWPILAEKGKFRIFDKVRKFIVRLWRTSPMTKSWGQRCTKLGRVQTQN